MRILIPESIDLDQLAQDTPKGIRRDMLAVFINLIYKRQFFQKKEEGVNPFVKLKSKILQSYASNYKQYFEYLKGANVIKINPHYLPGDHCRSYRFTAKYYSKGQFAKITDSSLIRKLNKKKQPTPIKALQHLQKWYNPGLQINNEKAMRLINEKYQQEAPKDKSSAIRAYNHSLLSIQYLEDCEFPFSVDAKTGRVYGLVTYMPKTIRKCLIYENGKVKQGEFVEIDIKNSQPFLLLGLLNAEKYRGWVSDSTPAPVYSSFISSSFDEVGFSFIQSSRIKDLLQEIQEYYSIDITIMLLKLLQLNESEQFKQFREEVLKGQFYEWIKWQFESLGFEKKDRGFYKELTLKSLFLDHKLLLNQKYLSNRRYEASQLFWHLNPELHSLVSIFKQGEYKRLARMLQSLEAFVMIDLVTKRIAKEYPYLPYYTIHDGLLVLKGYEEEAVQIIREECQKTTGYWPKVEVK